MYKLRNTHKFLIIFLMVGVLEATRTATFKQVIKVRQTKAFLDSGIPWNEYLLDRRADSGDDEANGKLEKGEGMNQVLSNDDREVEAQRQRGEISVGARGGGSEFGRAGNLFEGGQFGGAEVSPQNSPFLGNHPFVKEGKFFCFFSP